MLQAVEWITKPLWCAWEGSVLSWNAQQWSWDANKICHVGLKTAACPEEWKGPGLQRTCLQKAIRGNRAVIFTIISGGQSEGNSPLGEALWQNCGHGRLHNPLFAVHGSRLNCTVAEWTELRSSSFKWRRTYQVTEDSIHSNNTQARILSGVGLNSTSRRCT